MIRDRSVSGPLRLKDIKSVFVDGYIFVLRDILTWPEAGRGT